MTTTLPPPLPGYYCWIRLIDNLKGSMNTFGTGRPPKKKAFVEDLLTEDKLRKSACFHIGTDAHKPGTDDVFDIRKPAFANEPDAVAWAKTTKGRKWIGEAKDCVLVGFSFGLSDTDEAGA